MEPSVLICPRQSTVVEIKNAATAMVRVDMNPSQRL
jgi:hypothetical protein